MSYDKENIYVAWSNLGDNFITYSMDFKGTNNMVYKIQLIIVLCIFCTGCASTLDVFYDDQGRVYRIESRGTQHTTVNGILDTDTKQESLLDGLIKIQDAKVVK